MPFALPLAAPNSKILVPPMPSGGLKSCSLAYESAATWCSPTSLGGPKTRHPGTIFNRGSRSKIKLYHETWRVDFHPTPWNSADC